MKVVALVSGGKDSCMSMHLCRVHGHEARCGVQPLSRRVSP